VYLFCYPRIAWVALLDVLYVDVLYEFYIEGAMDGSMYMLENTARKRRLKFRKE